MSAVKRFLAALSANKDSHYLLAGMAVGSLLTQFRPDVFWQTTMAVFFVFKAYDKMTYAEE